MRGEPEGAGGVREREREREWGEGGRADDEWMEYGDERRSSMKE